MGGFHRDLNKEMGCLRKCSVEKGLVISVSVIHIRAGHTLWSPCGQFADPCFSTTILTLVIHSHTCWQAWRDHTIQGYHSWNTSVIQLQHKAIGDKVHPQNASTKCISSSSKSIFPILLNNANMHCISHIRNLATPSFPWALQLTVPLRAPLFLFSYSVFSRRNLRMEWKWELET